MKHLSHLSLVLSAAALAACTMGGKPQSELDKEVLAAPEKPAAPAAKAAAEAPVVNPDKALENYRKLLELPQTPEARAETMRRLADLELQQVEAGGGSFEQSEERLHKSVALYETLLKENAGSPANDRVLYQLSRAYQDMGETAKAEAALARMQREFPQSSYGEDAHFRRAELLYKLEKFDGAASEYRQVLQQAQNSPFFEPSQYKYGWTQYKLGNHEAAIDTFTAILNRELPPGELTDPNTALQAVRPGKKDTAADAVKVIVLSVVAKGGGDWLNRYFAAKGEPAFGPMLYAALADSLLESKRYTDAAAADGAFVASHPQHPLAPVFQGRAIAALQTAGLADAVVQAKEKYSRDYDPAAAYWNGRTATPESGKDLRANLEDLAKYYHSKAQKEKDQPAAAKADFLKAGGFYQRLLELYPNDARAAELRFLLAESDYEGGQSLAAAQEYDKVAATAGYAKAPEAAYAAVLAYHRYANEVPDADKPAALKQAIQSSLKLADKFPDHPQAATLVTRAAEDLYSLQAWDDAIAVGTRITSANPPAAEALRRTAWGVVADAQFSRKHFGEAEAAYRELLKLTPATAEGRGTLTERLASSIYKQGEAARSTNDQAAAASIFLRVGESAPGSSIRAAATYDAAAALIAAKDWPGAAKVLESFRKSFPAHTLIPDVDKKLALAYQTSGNNKEAAAVLKRIAARTTESAETRQDAAWLSLTMLEGMHDPKIALEYEAWIRQYPMPLDRAMECRKKLAAIAGSHNDTLKRTHWLHEIIAADAAAGAGRTQLSKSLAAEASLEFARQDAAKAGKLPLKAPLKQSLPVKKQAMEKAIASLTHAAEYGVAEVTTAATFELGDLYKQFSKTLLGSERPQKMSSLMAEQYKLMLQDQAFPFEEKAIQYHESNLQRVAQGVNNAWIGKSLDALGELDPGRYGKREKAADYFDAPAAAPVPVSLPVKTAKDAKGKPLAAPVPAAGQRTPQQDERYAKALALVKAGKWNDGQTEFIAFVRDFPRDAGGHVNLGIAFAHAARKDQAIAEFNAALALDPKNAAAQNWIGVLSRELGDFKRAEQSYRAALDTDPSYRSAHLNLAILYDQFTHNSAEALKEYRAYRDMAGKDDLRAAVWAGQIEGFPAPAATPTPATQAPAAIKASAAAGTAPATPSAEAAR
jgi:tetratricopeptide (TPR) repeat protein